MLRILHTADVHLGARHDDLGEQAAAQRERQFAAFKARRRPRPRREGRPVPDRRRPVRLERPAAPLGRARRRRAHAARRGADPDGHHPGHPRRLRPRVDLPRLRPRGAGRHRAGRGRPGHRPDPDHPSVHLAALDAVVHGPFFPTKRAPHSPLPRPRRASTAAAGDLAHRHGPRLASRSRARPTRRGRHHDRGDRRQRPRLPRARPLALAPRSRKAGGVTYAYAGAPEPVALDQDRAGKVLLVELDDAHRRPARVTVEERTGRQDHASSDSRSTPRPSTTPAGARRAARGARRPGPRPRRPAHRRPTGRRSTSTSTRSRTPLAARFLKVRVRDVATPALTEGALPPPDTIAGAFIRDLEARIAELEATAGARRAEAAEHRDALRLGRLLLAGHEVSL